MARRIRVGVIFGGRSGEHEVSLVSAGAVIHHLDPEKYEVVPIGITPDGRWVSSDHALELLKKKAVLSGEPEHSLVPEPHRRSLVRLAQGGVHGKPLDVLFPVVHGTYGEDGTLQGLLELTGIPYVGAGVLASAVGMDKIVQKMIFAEAGLPIVRYVWFRSGVAGAPSTVRQIERTLRYPLFVKPANTGSSVGITKAHTRKELVAGLMLAAEFDRKIIVEQGIHGVREIECGVLGNNAPEASVPGEIIPSNEFYDYDAKYIDGKSTAEIPAKLPVATAKRIRQLALAAYTALDCAGMARVDFFLSRDRGKLYLNEVNTIPGFTTISMYPKMWEATGVPFAELLDLLIAFAIERHGEMRARKTSYAPATDWYKNGEA